MLGARLLDQASLRDPVAAHQRQPASARHPPCYVRSALRAVRSHLAPAFVCALALASCGGGERQDKNEPEGDFKVEVVKASFPSKQELAKSSNLTIVVRNAETSRTVPNVAVTIKGFDARLEDSQAADPARPVFVINGRPKRIGNYPDSKERAPAGGETAYNGTWALGPLKAGKDATFKWNVTAVKPGPYQLTYEVAAGLNGKAKAVTASGRPPRGLLSGTIDDKAPNTRVAEDGHTVVESDR
jgi:hypothetical protein